MGLFLEGLYEKDYVSPSQVRLVVPVYSGENTNYATIRGLLATEPAISTGNKWGSILPDVSTLTEISSIMGSQSIFSWIGASTNAWKGTDAVSISLEIYFINYKRGLYLEEGLKQLTKLTALSPDGDAKTRVVTHGGYQADVLSTNNEYFSSDLNWKKVSEDTSNLFASWGTEYLSSSKRIEGTVTVLIGNKIKLYNLLVGKVETIPSLVETVDKKPLFYKTSVSLIGARPFLSTDVDDMFDS